MSEQRPWPAHVPLALYVHLPWCRSKCPYCDFNSYAVTGKVSTSAYVDALLIDLQSEAEFTGGRRLTSVFFGGGTPSLFEPSAIQRILSEADRIVGLAADAEVTMEANPGALECGPPAEYRAAGVNRLSLGVQSLDDGCLRRLGRLHDAATARAAVREAVVAGFQHLNVDLMFGLPGQSPAAALNDLHAVLGLGPDHVSHYQLTLEPGTTFAAKPPPLPDDDTCWEIQTHCARALAEAGFEHYEVSAFARPDARCRHNESYWLYGDYLGIGAGAHGKVTLADRGVLRREKTRHPRRYLERPGQAKVTRPSADERAFEFLLNAFRLTGGFQWRDFEERTGLERMAVSTKIEAAATSGLVAFDDQRCAPTELGLRFLNDLTAMFLPEDTSVRRVG